MSNRGRAVVYAFVSRADHTMLCALAANDEISMSALVRTALNDMLEARKLPLLDDLNPVGRPAQAEEHA